MTLQQLYQKTKAWMFEKSSSKVYDPYIIEIANKVLAELYNENNMMRIFKGKEPFTDGIEAHQIPSNASMSYELDYEEEYLFEVIPKGIDANFFMDDDLAKMSKYDVEYNNARVKCQVLVPQRLLEDCDAL